MAYEIISRNNELTYRVSVVIPVYNVEDYITDTLNSVLEQTLKGIEIILVDDGSTDSSEKIIRRFLDQSDSIVYVKQENAGPGMARNVGIELARGKFISFVDSDDLLPEKALETLYGAALRKEADIVTGASISFNSKKTWYIHSHASKGVYNSGLKTILSHPELLYSVGPCNKLFKTDLIQTLSFPTGIKVTEDHPFVIEAYLKAAKIYTVDDVIYKYRRRESENNTSLSQSVRVNAGSVLEDIMKSLKVSDPLWAQYVPNDKERTFLLAYYYHRIMLADLWPATINVLRSSKENDPYYLFSGVCEWLNNMDKRVLNALKQMGSNKKINAFQEMEQRKSILPLKQRIFADRLQKLINICKQLLKKVIIERIVYIVFSSLPLQNKTLYISDKITELDVDEKKIKQVIQNVESKNSLFVYLKKKKNIKDLYRYFYNLATANIIIIDEYTNPFQGLPKRRHSKIIPHGELRNDLEHQ